MVNDNRDQSGMEPLASDSYGQFLAELKTRIQAAQVCASLAVNRTNLESPAVSVGADGVTDDFDEPLHSTDIFERKLMADIHRLNTICAAPFLKQRDILVRCRMKHGLSFNDSGETSLARIVVKCLLMVPDRVLVAGIKLSTNR